MRRPDDAGTRSFAATPYEALLDVLISTAGYNRADAVPPAAVLWTDRDRWWEGVVPRLRRELPLPSFDSRSVIHSSRCCLSNLSFSSSFRKTRSSPSSMAALSWRFSSLFPAGDLSSDPPFPVSDSLDSVFRSAGRDDRCDLGACPSLIATTA